MPGSYRSITPGEFAESFGSRETFALEVLVGLSETPKRIPSKHHYDADGSRLFEQITTLPEYYPTRCEREILERRCVDIAHFVAGRPFNFVELGAGDGQKTAILIDHFLESGVDCRYVPIDISEAAMKDLVDRFAERFPTLMTEGLVADYFQGIKWLSTADSRRNLVIFLGSSIGNFNKPQARYFLRNAWNAMNHGDMILIGFDLKKDIEKLLNAYNDSAGITREFNLNVLRRINRELGGTFDIDRFRHFGTYDVFSGAMESYLVSLESQEVFIEQVGSTFHFDPWEPIHVEYSYKYLVSDVDLLAEETGFTVIEHMYDSRRWFVDSLWRVEKDQPPR